MSPAKEQLAFSPHSQLWENALWPQGLALTSEELEVGQGLRQHPTALLLHGQRDDQQPISQLREVLDEVVLPAERKRQLQSKDAGCGRAARPRDTSRWVPGSSPSKDGVFSLPRQQAAR